MHLTVEDVCDQLGVSRSTVLRYLRASKLTGVKRHSCGALCAKPFTCQHGTWEINPTWPSPSPVEAG